MIFIQVWMNYTGKVINQPTSIYREETSHYIVQSTAANQPLQYDYNDKCFIFLSKGATFAPIALHLKCKESVKNMNIKHL